jgi:hypothetical protein
MTDEELTQAMTDAVIFGTGVMQDGKRIDPLSFFVQPVSDPACEHCGMDPAALTEQLEAARQDAKEAEAYAEELEKERDRWREIANNEAVEGEANRNAGLALEAKLAKAVEALLLARVHVANNEQGWSVGRASARSDLKIINATLAEIEGEKG